ncbi:hypothetical protein MRB53_018310 [Persea americana]|uniref:Uncharacterized protein n=1 Tax=Persea americana TaxID=3435 RepID=A0ACC2M8G7_PERAE|nr:hypothetical protein MRB53_018310 [Persea americana]
MQVSEETPSSQLTHWKIFSCSTVHRQQLRMNLMDGAACVTSGTQGSYTMGQEIFRTQLIHHSTSSSPPPSSSPSPSPAPLSGSPPTRNRVRKGEDEPLHFYFHDIVSSRADNKQMALMFGTVFMMDNALTEGPEPASKMAGRAQGLYASAS